MSEQHPTPTTLRQILEAIVRLHSVCGNCEHGVICQEVEYAQDGLRMLDEAETIDVAVDLSSLAPHRLVPDSDDHGKPS